MEDQGQDKTGQEDDEEIVAYHGHFPQGVEETVEGWPQDAVQNSLIQSVEDAYNMQLTVSVKKVESKSIMNLPVDE